MAPNYASYRSGGGLSGRPCWWARTDHRGKGYFVFAGGWEYTMVVVGLVAVGPGEWSVDHAIGIADLAGWEWAVGVAVVGVAGALGMLAACYRPTPSTES